MHRRSCLPWIILLLVMLGLLAVIIYIPVLARQSFGPPSPYLNAWQRFSYSLSLVWGAGDLTTPVDAAGIAQEYVIESGETAVSISERLEAAGLIRDADIFRVYLVYTGLDTSIQAGTYQLSPGMGAIQIAQTLQDATPRQVTFYVLPGWRMEEIADSLPTSGLSIPPQDFKQVVASFSTAVWFLPLDSSAEGFLYPDAYTLPRSTSAEQLVEAMLQSFETALTAELRDGFTRQGLDIFHAVILASIVEREAIIDEEKPMIASVFFNRLNAGMKLDSDPTVQYALGYDPLGGTWWKNPLYLDDLQVDSLYNTYLYSGLPPGPICNPGFESLQAVSYPAQSPYYYFRRRCDDSNLHAFAETFEQHVLNACP